MSGETVQAGGGTTAGLEPSAAAPESRGRSVVSKAIDLFERYTLVFLGIGIAIFFSLYGKTGQTFFTTQNLQTLAGNQAVTATVALGALMPLVAYRFDLSVGAIAAVAAVFSAAAFGSGASIPEAIVLAVALGALIGLVNGLIIVRLGVNDVVTTLGTSTILAGVLIQKTGGVALVSNIPSSLLTFGSETTFGIPRVTIAMIAIALVVYYVLKFTPFGRYAYALGANEHAAALAGVRTKLVLAGTFVAAGLICGAAGLLQVARSGSADPRLAENFLLPALAAAFLSAASVEPGKYNVGGTLIAIYFLAILNNGLNLAGVPVYVNSYINGAALIIGIALAVFLSKRRRA